MHKILIVPKGLLPEESRSSLLRRRSLKLHAAPTAERTLAVVEKLRPALIMFSSQILEMGAENFCMAIKRIPGLEDTKLLMITDQVGDVADDYTGVQADGHLLSPVEDSDLYRTIAGLLKISLRGAKRVPVDLIARLDLLAKAVDGDVKTEVSILNLSQTGLLIESPVVLTVGSLGRVQFFLPGSSERLSLFCVVRMLADEILLHYGVELLANKEREKEMLGKFVQEIGKNKAGERALEGEGSGS